MTKTATDNVRNRWEVWVFLAFVIVLSYLTYFHRYWQPPAVFWDENYHIASAQKYLNGVYFMEQHPPLGKLLIALGEALLHPNPLTDQFLATDYGTDFPPGFSFAGYRLLPALLGWWTASLFFVIFLLLTRNALLSALLSFLYIFDNALIVHIRGAMLEGPLIFFCTLMILSFLLFLRHRENEKFFPLLSLLLGVSFGLILSTKVLGLLFILLAGAAAWTLRPRIRRIIAFGTFFLTGFLLVFLSVWYIHFTLGRRIQPELPDNGFYQASAEYKAILRRQEQRSLSAFPVMLRDSLRYIPFYNRGAPRLDLCKTDENGSPFYFWPLGARSINYRWETPDGKVYRYLYLQSNPIVWFTGLASALLAAMLLIVPLFFPLKRPLKNRFLLTVFLGMYVAFFVGVSRIDRVLYLYHYFIALLLTFVLTGLVLLELQSIGRRMLDESGKTLVAMVLGGLVFASYLFYHPLTYYEPLTNEQLQRRAIFPIWELSCVQCERVSGLVVPVKPPPE